MKISKNQANKIKAVISKLFDRAKARLMGRHFSGPFMVFGLTGYEPENSIEGVYRHAGISGHMQFSPNNDSASDLSEIVGNYLDSHKLKTIAGVMSGIERASDLSEASKVLRAALDKSKDYVELVADSELGRAQAVADREGVTAVAASIGVEDPMVAFLGRYDDRTCISCRQMYHRSDNPAIPIVYKLSQVSGGQFKSKEWDHSTCYFPQLHPRCRHRMTFIAPGYGFDDSGKVVFKGFDFSALKDQGNLSKSEAVSGICTCP